MGGIGSFFKTGWRFTNEKATHGTSLAVSKGLAWRLNKSTCISANYWSLSCTDWIFGDEVNVRTTTITVGRYLLVISCARKSPLAGFELTQSTVVVTRLRSHAGLQFLFLHINFKKIQQNIFATATLFLVCISGRKHALRKKPYLPNHACMPLQSTLEESLHSRQNFWSC